MVVARTIGEFIGYDGGDLERAISNQKLHWTTHKFRTAKSSFRRFLANLGNLVNKISQYFTQIVKNNIIPDPSVVQCLANIFPLTKNTKWISSRNLTSYPELSWSQTLVVDKNWSESMNIVVLYHRCISRNVAKNKPPDSCHRPKITKLAISHFLTEIQCPHSHPHWLFCCADCCFIPAPSL